jgi:hydroxyacylglutathione hydrolase
MTLHPLPAFTDNYIWILHNGHEALVVDPGDAAPVMEALRRYALTLHTILVTHHHSDHTGGVAELREATGARVYGPAFEAMPEPLTRLGEGDTVQGPGGLSWRVIEVPGHTAGHIAYYAEPEGEPPILFCGDTLFSAGCGRLFEGTPAQMLDSLGKLAALPGSTRVCCTHEYTLSNLRFALAVEPDNQALQDYASRCQALRAQALPTLPSSMALELDINPFLRSHLGSVSSRVRAHDPQGMAVHGVFAALREWKNTF